MITGFVAKAINRPIIIIPVDHPRDTDAARSWVDPKFPNHVYLGNYEDLPHELMHTLDFILGTEATEKLLGTTYEHAYIKMFGDGGCGYDEEDFADCMVPCLISASKPKPKKNIPIADFGELDGHPRSVRKHNSRKRST